MREYKYEIPICRDNSPAEFKLACSKIDQQYPTAEKKQLLVDVDGSTIQVYYIEGKKLVIYDDYDVGAVFAMSDIDVREALA